MIALVTGGAASGKSAYAEALACKLSPTRSYIATMANDSAEAQARIERHRQQRADGDFETIECDRSLEPACSQQHAGVALLDDLGNLVSRALFAPDGSMADPTDTADRLERELMQLFASFEHTVIVGNEVGCDGGNYDDTTLTWIRLMGSLGCSIATHADTVVEVIAGCPLVLKGRTP